MLLQVLETDRDEEDYLAIYAARCDRLVFLQRDMLMHKGNSMK